MQDHPYPSPELVANWSALLDGELPTDLERTLMAEIEAHPESAAFIEGQRRFNDAISTVMNAGLDRSLSASLRLKMLASIKQEANLLGKSGGTAPALRALQPIAPSQPTLERRVSMGWALSGMAAMLVIGLAIGALVLGSGTGANSGGNVVVNDGTQTGPVVASTNPDSIPQYRRLEVFGGVGSKLMLNLGSKSEEVEAYARSHGYDRPIPTHPGVNGEGEMKPVNFTEGTIEGLPYTAFTMCGGPAKKANLNGTAVDECPSIGKLERVVLFIVEGDLRPSCAKIDERSQWMSCMPGKAFAARWDPKSNRTYLLYVPGNVEPERVRELAEPLVTLDAGTPSGLK